MESQNHNKQVRCGAKLTDHRITCTGDKAHRHVGRIIQCELKKLWEIRVLLRNTLSRRAVSQRFEQIREPVVVYFMHQLEQSADFS
jgi:hypothetical protein